MSSNSNSNSTVKPSVWSSFTGLFTSAPVPPQTPPSQTSTEPLSQTSTEPPSTLTNPTGGKHKKSQHKGGSKKKNKKQRKTKKSKKSRKSNH
jgi:hypothetical protein